MKKRELAVAICGLQFWVMALVIIIAIGPGKLGAFLDTIVPMLTPLLWIGAVLLLVIGIPLGALIGAMDFIEQPGRFRREPWRATFCFATLFFVAVSVILATQFL
jgi:hypothetical protein